MKNIRLLMLTSVYSKRSNFKVRGVLKAQSPDITSGVHVNSDDLDDDPSDHRDDFDIGTEYASDALHGHTVENEFDASKHGDIG